MAVGFEICMLVNSSPDTVCVGNESTEAAHETNTACPVDRILNETVNYLNHLNCLFYLI